MLVGYMRVSTDTDRQVLDLQRDALIAAGVDERHLFEDRVSGSRGDRAGLACRHECIRAGLQVLTVSARVGQDHRRTQGHGRAQEGKWKLHLLTPK